jgi:hypothetical protein
MTFKSEIQKQKANCRAQLDFFIKQSKATLEQFGNHTPMFFVPMKPEGFAMVVPDFHDDVAKDASIKSLKGMLIQFNSDYFVHVSECWIITRQPDEEIVRPSTAKDKQEALLIVYNQRDGRRIDVTIPFGKGECGKLFFGKPSEHYSGFGAGDDYKKIEGRFADIARW